MTEIAEILQDMLTRQTGLTAKTTEVASKKGSDGKFQRPEELDLQNVSHDEGALADDSKKVTKLLTDDKSTVIFPEIMKDIEADLRDLQSMLDAKQVDELVQAMQGNVERNLQELLDALKKEMSKKKAKKQGGSPPPGSGGGGGGKKDPLVPPTAELKMLQFKQIGIQKLTTIANKQKETGKQLPAQTEAQHKKLAQQQKDLETRVRDFAKLLDSNKGPMQ
jgi:exonuclease VII large subunit